MYLKISIGNIIMMFHKNYGGSRIQEHFL